MYKKNYLLSIKNLLFLFTLISLLFLSNVKAEAFSGGTGTVADPYLISSTADFLTIANDANAHYKLAANIDMANTTFNGFGSSSNTWFRGSLDGNGFSIKNMTINQPSGNNVGLFSGIYSNNATYTGVKNITFENANVTGSNYVGIITGTLQGTNTNYKPSIENVKIISSKVNSTSGYTYIGGLVGHVPNYSIIKSIQAEIDVDVNTSYTSTLQHIGGIVGYSNYLDMSNIISNGSVSVDNVNGTMHNIGGIVGYSTYTNYIDVDNFSRVKIYPITTAGRIGGVTGLSHYSSFSKSSNRGDITIQGSGNYSSIGGLVGEHYYSSSATYSTTNSVNSGNITINTSNGSTSQIGGFIGHSYLALTISKIQSTGDITINSTSASDVGGLFGHLNPYSQALVMSDSTSNSKILITSPTINYAGGLIGNFLSYSSQSILQDSYSTGRIETISSSASNYIGGLVGRAYGTTQSCYYETNPTTGEEQLYCYESAYPTSLSIKNTYSDTTVQVSNSASAGAYPAGLISYSYNLMNNSLALNPKIINGTNETTTVNADFSTNSGAKTNIRKLDAINAPAKAATNITLAQAKQWSTYSGLTWDSSIWGINETKDFPYLKKVIPATMNITKPTPKQGFQGLTIPLEWEDKGERNTASYSIKVEQLNSATNTWSLVNTFTSSTPSYSFNVPAGTPGNTTFRYTVKGKNHIGDFGFESAPVEFVFTNNTPVVTGTFTSAQKDLTVSLDKRVMPFTISTVKDVDNFNFVKVFAEVVGITGSKKQIGAQLEHPITWSAKNYKLKLLPTFSSTSSTYSIAIVDAANENTVITTLASGRAMQAPSAAAPESFTFKISVEDYQNTNNTLLSASAPIQQTFTVDTRNFLPRTFNTQTDIGNRIMSSDQGYNRIKFSGSIEDLDPNDGISVYYTIKLATDKIDGKYVVNPTTDTFIKTIATTGSGAVGDFNATYTIQESMLNGSYVILLYGKDTRGGIGDPIVIPFTVNKTNPDIRFFATYKGNTISTAQRQVVAKDTKLKMYFSAYNYTTFEYAGYLVRTEQQRPSGAYEDLRVRGAFTNDVSSQFIGIDLSDKYYKKGDIIVFKFRATNNLGAKIEKDVRILIGEVTNTFTDINDTKIPSALLISP